MSNHSRSTFGYWLLLSLVMCWAAFVAYSWVHAFATCRGHVVKNWADFPVCVS